MRPNLYLPKLIHFVLGLVEIVLMLRIVLRLFAANPNASFVNWVYSTSDTLIQPFRGIFPTTVIEKSYVLDFTALFALIIYALVGSLLGYLVAVLERVAMAPVKSTSKKR
jgi:uncharacterized protein YggT (Ycf19 family)